MQALEVSSRSPSRGLHAGLVWHGRSFDQGGPFRLSLQSLTSLLLVITAGSIFFLNQAEAMGARLLLLVLAGTLDIKLGFFVGKSFFLSCVYVCVCSHNCVYVCIFMCMCTRVWKSEVNVGCLPQSPTTLFSETESLMEP